jgi:hypothetical protein
VLFLSLFEVSQVRGLIPGRFSDSGSIFSIKLCLGGSLGSLLSLILLCLGSCDKLLGLCLLSFSLGDCLLRRGFNFGASSLSIRSGV